jgi:DNA-binding LytR/AlgR family response regulator
MKKSTTLLSNVDITTERISPLAIAKPMAQDLTSLLQTHGARFFPEPVSLGNLMIKLKEVLLNEEPLSATSSYIFVKVESRLERVDVKDIIHIQAMADYVNIHTKKKKYTVLSTMKGIERKLPSRDFTRVHKSYIVRIDCISEIENDTITVEKNIIPLSLSYRKQFKDRLNII